MSEILLEFWVLVEQDKLHKMCRHPRYPIQTTRINRERRSRESLMKDLFKRGGAYPTPDCHVLSTYQPTGSEGCSRVSFPGSPCAFSGKK